MSTASQEKLLTAEEFGSLPDDGRLSELVRGKIVSVGAPDLKVVRDCVQGPDAAYFSYVRLLKGSLQERCLPVSSQIVFEVRSPEDRWKKVLVKVAEFLKAGVTIVCVLDPEPRTIHVYHADQPSRILERGEDLTFPDVLPEFRVAVRHFFE